MALIRYPGSKDKLFDGMANHFPMAVLAPLFSDGVAQYIEPFFGAGSVGLRLMRIALPPKCSIRLNDKDPGIAALWQSVHRDPRELCNLITRFVPSGERFYEFKKSDGTSTGDIAQDGFRKLALHQISFSGLGYMAGGPLGGKEQNNSKYNPACRWKPARLHKQIDRLHRRMALFSDLEITSEDFEPVIAAAGKNAFVYADPPYYEKGPQLYKHSMSQTDHERLAACLKGSPASWALSYDDHPEVRRLYRGYRIEPVHATYTTATARTEKRPKNREIVILKDCAA